jgi:hypothetical protein
MRYWDQEALLAYIKNGDTLDGLGVLPSKQVSRSTWVGFETRVHVSCSHAPSVNNKPQPSLAHNLCTSATAPTFTSAARYEDVLKLCSNLKELHIPMTTSVLSSITAGA